MTGSCPDVTVVRATFHRYVIDANRAAGRGEPLSGAEHHGTRARSRISTGDRSGEGGARRPTRSRPRRARLPRALPRRARGRGRAGARPARGRGALRLPLDPLAHPVPVRRDAARLQHRHRTRGGAARRRWRPPSRRLCADASGYTSSAERPLQGRLDHAPLRPARGSASMPSRWRSRSPPTSQPRPRPLPTTRARPPASALTSAPSSRRSRTSPSLNEDRHDQPAPQHPRRLSADRSRDQREELADRSADADADEQPASGRGREPARAGGLRRHRARGAHLGGLRPHRRGVCKTSRRTRRWWCSRAGRWPSCGPMRMRRVS